MKKVFCYIGSKKGNSETKALVESFLSELKSISDIEIAFTIRTSADTHICSCEGCRSCFKGKKCHLNKVDNFNLIIDEMLESDLIIFASPVYLNNVSGDMKTFLDRIAFLTHLFMFAGKCGFIFSCGDSSGVKQVNSYLRLIQTTLGIKVIGQYGRLVAVNSLDNELIRKIATVTLKYLKNEINYLNDKELNSNFLQFRDYFKNENSIAFSSERKMWKDRGMLELNSFKELVENTRLLNMPDDCKIK